MLTVYNRDLHGEAMQPKKSSFANLSNEALCKLRDEIVTLLNSRAEKLRLELERLTNGSVATAEKVGETPKKKIVPKFRGPHGETWAGRGMKPRWLMNAMKEGKNQEDFRIAR
jgi:DNA-binding protein H-NS